MLALRSDLSFSFSKGFCPTLLRPLLLPHHHLLEERKVLLLHRGEGIVFLDRMRGFHANPGVIMVE